MPQTTCHMSVSLDGFVAGPDQDQEHPLGVGDLRFLPVEVLHSPHATHVRYRVERRT